MALGEIIKRREHTEVKFSDRTQSKRGILSVFFAVLCLALLVAMVGLSAAADGQGAWYVGLGGFGALALSVAGFTLGVRSFREDNIYHGFPVTGAVLNGILMLVVLALYVAGFVG